jgi:cbb3-type cytochrome oxidase maturation protein
VLDLAHRDRDPFRRPRARGRSDGLGLGGFLWTLKSGQYDDFDDAGWRAIMDDEDEPVSSPGPD